MGRLSNENGRGGSFGYLVDRVDFRRPENLSPRESTNFARKAGELPKTVVRHAEPCVYNEYGRLESVLLCPPEEMDFYEPIDEVHRQFDARNNGPRTERFEEEYRSFVETLLSNNVNMHFVSSSTPKPYQHYTRDIGFAIGNRFFLGNMREAARANEVAEAKAVLESQGLVPESIPEGTIEGGDVLVHYPYVLIGQSKRTNAAATSCLQSLLGSEWQVVPIALKGDLALHLDCALSIVSKDTAIWCPDAIHERHHSFLRSLFHLIDAKLEEVARMGVNTVALGDRTILVEEEQQRLQRLLKARGLRVLSIDWAELRKLGGLFRCATCPLSRS